MSEGQEAEPKRDLGERFRRLIRAHGPMSVSRFMGESNAHYYASRDPLGAPNDSGETGGGDFITAPDISQMFGEFVGLWLTDIWMRAGAVSDAAYVELGPGRGTLAVDALRSMAPHGLAPAPHLVEGSPVLRDLQRAALPAAQFHDDTQNLPKNGPLLIVANEFLDALPIRQLVKTASGWRERLVALDGEHFLYAAGPNPMDAGVPEIHNAHQTGTVLETCPAAAAIMQDLAARLARQGGAALFIDYGYLTPQTGSTLQAVQSHQKIDALAAPGEADLTAHVDFATLAEIASGAGLRVQSATQGEWLEAMGIGMRAQALAASAPDRAEEIETARQRLVAPEQMGELFKVLAVTSQDWPEGAGFPPE